MDYVRSCGLLVAAELVQISVFEHHGFSASLFKANNRLSELASLADLFDSAQAEPSMINGAAFRKSGHETILAAAPFNPPASGLLQHGFFCAF